MSLQTTLTRSSSSAGGGYLRTSISVPRLPQNAAAGKDKHKLRSSVSVPRLPQHSPAAVAAVTPPAPGPGAAGSSSSSPGPGPGSPALHNHLGTDPGSRVPHPHPHRQQPLPSSTHAASSSDQEVLLWVYTETTKLYLFTTPQSESLPSVHDFLRRTQKLSPADYELAVLTPGLLYPVLLQNIHTDTHNGGVVLCLPATDLTISIQTQDRHVFHTRAHPLDSIADIKTRIQEAKGYPVGIQDLTLDGRILRNDESVLDYHMSQETRLFLILQPCKKFPVQVDTFWGIKYTVEVGACTLVKQVIELLLRKTMRTEEVASDFHKRIFHKDKPLYQSLVRLETVNSIMKENLCLGYYKVSRSTGLRLTSVGEVNKDNSRMVQVLLENGVTVHTNAAKYDNWYIVVLKLHGITGKPLDVMRLQVNEELTELTRAVGSLKPGSAEVTHAKLATLRESASETNNLHNAKQLIDLEVKTLNGVLENVQCSAKDTIQDVKLKLERAGVPEARHCDVLYKKVKLPSSSKLQDYKLAPRTQLELRMGEFPVQVMWATNTFQLIAQAQQPISDLLAKIQSNTGANPIKSAVLFAGRNLYEIQDLVIQASTLYVNSTIYVETLQTSHVLHLVTVDNVIPIPIRPNLDSLHLHQLSHLHLQPELFLKSLHWFIRWRFPARRGNTSRASAAAVVAGHSTPPRHKPRNAPADAMSASMTGFAPASGSDPRQGNNNKPGRLLDQRSRTMPILSLVPRDVNHNHSHNHHPLRRSFDFTDLGTTGGGLGVGVGGGGTGVARRDSGRGRSLAHIRSNSLDKRDRSLDRLTTTVVNIREHSPVRRERSLDRTHALDRGSLPVDPTTGGASGFLMHSNSDELSSSLTPSSSNSSPGSSGKSPGPGFYNGLPAHRPGDGGGYPRRGHRQLPQLPNDLSPSSTPDSTPASKKKLQVRFELPTAAENGGANGDKNTATPVKSALKKGTKSYGPIKITNYGMTISTPRSRSVDSGDYPDVSPVPRSKTVVDYYPDEDGP